MATVLSLLIVLSGCGRYIKSVKTPLKANNKTNFVSTYDTVQKKSIKETTVEKTTISATIPTTETTISKVETKPVETTVATDNKEKEIENYIEAETEPTDEVIENIVIDNGNDYASNVDLLARIIYFESGSCSEYCQWLVGSTAMNLADEYGSLEAVAFNYDIFNVANILYTDTPSSLSYSVATRIINGDRDINVRAFRTDYYHSFGSPYTSVDNVYFNSY